MGWSIIKTSLHAVKDKQMTRSTTKKNTLDSCIHIILFLSLCTKRIKETIVLHTIVDNTLGVGVRTTSRTR